MSGSFQTNRDIFDHSIWQDIIKFRIFFFIYGNAVFSKEGVNKGSVHVKRGQFLKSYRKLIEELEYVENKQIKRYSLSTVQRKIKELVKEERLLLHETELGTLFEVVNYELYQGFEQFKNDNVERNMEHSQNSSRTVAEQSQNNNKKDNKDKKDKNVIQQQSGAENWIFAYEKNYGMVSPRIIQMMNSYLDDGMEQKVLCFALEKAADNGQGFHYAKGIINNWLSKNIYTYDAVIEEEEAYQKRKVERIHGNEKWPKINRQNPKPIVKGSDPSQFDWNRKSL